MHFITLNSSRAQTESESLLSSLELSVQLLAAIRKENVAIYQFRPVVTFEKKDGSDVEYVKFSYAYKYNNINPGVYPAFVSMQVNNAEGIVKANEDIIYQIQEHQSQNP